MMTKPAKSYDNGSNQRKGLRDLLYRFSLPRIEQQIEKTIPVKAAAGKPLVSNAMAAPR